MRLTADLIRAAPAYTNPIKEREVSFRGYKIPAIENLGVTQDQFETIDFSDNEIVKLENFPVLPRLHTLLFSNNRVNRVDSGLGSYLPHLESLILINNRFTTLDQLDALADLASLRTLSLMGNPVTAEKNYRLYVLFKIPQVTVLDFHKVKPQEREQSKKVFGEPIKPKKKGAKPDAKFEEDAVVAASKAKELEEEKTKIREAILNATSIEEVARLEKQLQNGFVAMES